MAKIIWGFPGIGKTFFSSDKFVYVDADCELFKFKVENDQLHRKEYYQFCEANQEYPTNYIDYVNELDVDIVFVNCHISLLTQFSDVLLVYPDITLKEEYLSRYNVRGDNASFIDYMKNNFDDIVCCLDETPYPKIKIRENNIFLKDLLESEVNSFMFMTKKELISLLEKGFSLEQNEDYKKCGSTVLQKYGLVSLKGENVAAGSFDKAAMDIFEGNTVIDIEGLRTDILRAENDINQFHKRLEAERIAQEKEREQELLFTKRRCGLSREELANKIMQGIINGALGIKYDQIAPYSHGYEVTFGPSSIAGSTRPFDNRWECYCDFFEIGNKIVKKIEQGDQDSVVFGDKYKNLSLEIILEAIDQKEKGKISSFIPEKDTDFKRSENYYRGSIATVMDVHAGKGLDGIVKSHYHGDYSSMTPSAQNTLVECLVYMKGFCLDVLESARFSNDFRANIVDYLKTQGTDICTPEKLQAWIRNNPEKCAREENRKLKPSIENRINSASKTVSNTMAQEKSGNHKSEPTRIPGKER